MRASCPHCGAWVECGEAGEGGSFRCEHGLMLVDSESARFVPYRPAISGSVAFYSTTTEAPTAYGESSTL